MTIAGRNGAGKTTLLRMLAGETSIDRGELTRREGRAHRAARPAPAARARRSRCATTCSRAAPRSSRSRPSWRSWRRRMAGGRRPTRRLLARYARAQARLEARGGYLWRDRATAMAHGLGFRDEDLDRPLDTFSGGQLTRASLARALADRRRRAAAGRAHEPPRHRVAGVARADARRPRRGDRAGRPRPLVPGGGRHGGAGARGRPLALLRRHLAPVAQGAGGARDRAGQGDRQAAGRDRADGALHRALPLQGDEGRTGAVARQEARQDRAHRARPGGRAGAGVPLRRARAHRAA